MKVSVRSIDLVFVTLLWTSAGALVSPECEQSPITEFNLNKMIDCGHNGQSWSIWKVPGEEPYCLGDVIDKADDGKYLCYALGKRNGTCLRISYLYHPDKNVNGPNYFERDLGSNTRSKSLILDTDNCKYLVQLECFPDGSVTRYVTYKNTWTSEEKEQLKVKAENIEQLRFLRDYTFNCVKDRV